MHHRKNSKEYIYLFECCRMQWSSHDLPFISESESTSQFFHTDLILQKRGYSDVTSLLARTSGQLPKQPELLKAAQLAYDLTKVKSSLFV